MFKKEGATLCYKDRKYIIKMLRKSYFFVGMQAMFAIIFISVVVSIFVFANFPNKGYWIVVVCMFMVIFWTMYFKIYQYYFVKMAIDIKKCDEYIIIETFSKTFKVLNDETHVKGTFLGSNILILTVSNEKKQKFYIFKDKQVGLKKINNINYDYLRSIFSNYYL